MPNIRWLLRLVTVIHRFVYSASRGWIGGRLMGMDMLLLTHIGRRSGKVRAAPLLYVPIDSHFVVVASNAGDDRSPDWWLNLKQQPATTIRAKRELVSVRARQAEGEEEAQLWAQLIDSYGPYGSYRERTTRQIPVVVLERI